MKNISIRLDDRTAAMLPDLSTRPTTAAQTAVETLLWLRQATLRELKGLFNRAEIIGLADSFNGLIPTWQIMVNPSVLVAHTEDAEHYQSSLTMHGADPAILLPKLEKLTAAQATILQLELWAFWNRDESNPSPDLEQFVNRFI